MIVQKRVRDPATVGKLATRRDGRRIETIIAGTRVPTSALWSFAEEGYDIDQVHAEYPDLDRADVVAALEHERVVVGPTARASRRR